MKKEDEKMIGEKLERMNGLLREKARVERELEEAFRPLCDDMGLAEELYRVYAAALRENDREADPGTAENRRKFLFAALYVYSPASLCGRKLRPGLRDRLTETVGGITPTSLSHSIEGLSFLYTNYRPFRRDVDHILGRVLERIGKQTHKV